MNRTNIFSAIIALLVLAGTGWLVSRWWRVSESANIVDAAKATSTGGTTLIVLSDAKTKAAGICTERVTRESLQQTRTLPGRFAYDDRRHVAVRAATDALIESVNVKPGDNVQTGQQIAVLRSPAIGAARSEVLRRQSELELAEIDRRWQADICAGVEKLVADIRSGRPVKEIELAADQGKIGKYGGELLMLYSKSLLATDLSESVADLAGAVSGRVVRQRRSEQQQSTAELEAMMDQALFETGQACKAAAAKVDAAQRNLIVARQQLTNLLGVTDAAAQVSPNETDLARLDIVSPLAGTVEQRGFSARERVTAGAELFVIADTSRLWVEADVRGRDWSAMRVREGDTVTITTPADPDNSLSGTVYYVGRQVDPASGAVPIVIEVANQSNRYRPGLFARVEVPIGQVVDAIAIPHSAIVDLEGQPSVFVAHADGYRPAGVEVGEKIGDHVEIRAGLSEGQSIVTAGAFALKSELLLEGEE